MTSPGGRIAILVEPDLRGFTGRLSSGLTSSARTGVAAFASAAKVALLGAAVGIGAAGVVAAKSTLNIGIEYQNQLNTLQAVSGATEAQMKSVGVTAKALGQDLTLPATSAADAAAVMTELAKANFSVDEAQQAAKGSLQLAAAAQIDGARAATIQANAINAFNLKASDASRVADVLANAANASSAEITDVADALSQASAVAASAKIPIEDTAAVIGILANNGIRGSDAGTLLKSALLALQSPSKQARQAMDDLNLTAYDSQGNFVGLRSIFEQLQVAQGHMTQQQYEMATSTLFGSDAARLAGIAAKEGGKGFDEMAKAVSRQGAAAEVAAAKSRGLGGAIQAFKSQVETVQIDVFERAAPSLERLVRAAAERLPAVAASALDTADQVVSAFQEMAPRIGRALATRRDTVVAAWRQLGEPLVPGARARAHTGRAVIVEAAPRLSPPAGPAIDTVEPLAHSVGNLASSLAKANGPLDQAGNLLGVAADAGGVLLDVAGPLVRVLSGAVDIVSGLPGPLEAAVLGLVAFRVAGGRAAEWANSGLTGRMTGPFREFGQTVRMQMALADDSISRSQAFRGGLATALERQAPKITGAWQEISGAYRGGVAEASKAWSKHGLAVDGFATRVSGMGRAAQTAARVGIGGLQSAGAGLVGFLGGPWGAALAAGTLAVGAVTSSMQASEDQTAQWAKALTEGGQAASNALRDAAKEAGNHPDNWLGDWFHDMNVKMGLAPDLGEAVKGAKDYFDSLSPVAQAQAKVAEWTNTLSFRLQDQNSSAQDVAIAQQRLAFWTGQVGDRQTDLTTAAQTATAALQAQTQAALASTNADVAASQAQTSLQQTIASSVETIKSSTATDLEKKAASDQMAQAAIAAANAAAAQAAAHSTATTEEGKQRDADAALYASLVATAQQLGSNTPAAISSLIESLKSSAGQGVQTAAAMDELGLSVTAIPGSKDIRVNAPTEDQKRRLSDLGLTVTRIPGTKDVTVHAATAEAQAALDAFVRQRRVITIQTNYAQGGPLNGPARRDFWTGGYTGDGPRLGRAGDVHFGEFVHDAPTTMRVGRPGMEAIHRGDWATAAARFAELAQTQSRASMAALAGQRAARAAGEYVAGGFVDRGMSSTGVVTVPQRVTNIQNTLNAVPSLPTVDQLQRMQRKAEVLADA